MADALTLQPLTMDRSGSSAEIRLPMRHDFHLIEQIYDHPDILMFHTVHRHQMDSLMSHSRPMKS
ncbi:hypothetical protein J6590_025851 [Homalodisca vitripennis]|nr:hypothetical protein J6590_025851 [Homalodisca vitripennis]